jgi:hypothetical protein
MKMSFALIALSLSLGAFAQVVDPAPAGPAEVLLNSKNVRVGSDEAVLVRTSSTPDVVKVSFQVRMASSVCEQMGTRMVSTICYDNVVTRYRTADVCIRRNPYSNRCVNWGPGYANRVTRVARSCVIPQTYCVSYGTNVRTESDEVKIKFKNLPVLAGTEEDKFLVKATQKNYGGSNVVYDIKVVESRGNYVVKDRGFLGFDKFVIKEE